MYTDSCKLHIIKAVLKTDGNQTLSQFEQLIQQMQQPGNKKSVHDFAGILTKEDA